MAVNAQLSTAVRDLVHGYVCHLYGDTCMRLISTSKAIPLYKNGLGELRPISIPSVWRKAGSSWAQKGYQPEILSALRHEQYGAGRSARCASHGNVVCGYPLTMQEDAEFGGNEPHALPFGTQALQAEYFAKKQRQYVLKLTTLRALKDSVDQSGLRVVLHILRTSLQQTMVHLLRALPITVTRPWSLALDELTTAFVAEVFHL